MVNDTPTSPVNQEEKENIKENIVASKGDNTASTETKKAEASATNGTKQIDYNPNVKHPLKHTWTLWYDAELTGMNNL